MKFYEVIQQNLVRYQVHWVSCYHYLDLNLFQSLSGGHEELLLEVFKVCLLAVVKNLSSSLVAASTSSF